jgi:crotonobetainyl-CoA:carnitine CoA-transferase CaiB-like acyl-CoA transferase
MDKVTSLNAVQAVTAALLAKERGQGGQHIKLAMIDAAVHFLYPDNYWNNVWDPENVPKLNLEWQHIQEAAVFECADGKVAMQASMDGYTGILKVIGMTELLLVVAGKVGRDLIRWWALEGQEPVRAKMKSMSKQAVFDGCLEFGVPCGKFMDRDEVEFDPQIVHNETIQTFEHPVHGKYNAPRPPARFSKTPSQIQGHPPEMGEHNDEVLRDFGFSDSEVGELRRDGVIGT